MLFIVTLGRQTETGEAKLGPKQMGDEPVSPAT
jgi:hypothetical protein